MSTVIQSERAGDLGRRAEDRPAVRVAVAGATGYAGRELLRRLARHSGARLVHLASSGRRAEKPLPIEHAHPALRGELAPACHPIELEDFVADRLDLVFLATPHETSVALVPALLERGLRVVDLSGAFRLKGPGAYPRWYGFAHGAQEELRGAVYGLTELYRELIPTARLVSNPGCYATSVILALAPLLRAGWVDVGAGLIADSKSGASGAGRSPSNQLHFPEVNENCRAYGLFSHRHLPEILQALQLAEKDFVLTPHLLPITRGILSTIYARLTAPRAPEEIVSLYREFYRRSPLVRIYEDGALPEIQAVAHTDYADLGFALDPARGATRLIVVSALDNLGKGAAGQAIQNMNLMCGFPEETGLECGL